MGFWVTVLGTVMLAGLGCMAFLVTRLLRFYPFAALFRRTKFFGIAAALGVLLIPIILMAVTCGMLNAVICVIHLAIIWIICDLCGAAVRHLFHVSVSGGLYPAGIAAIAITVVYLGCCWFMAHHVTETDYVIHNDTVTEELRIVQISDAHIGTTFDAGGFRRAADKIAAADPDVIVITGDFADSGTTEQDLIECCRALSEIRTTYGIYFSYGNHDRSYKSDMDVALGGEDLEAILTEHGIRILQDDSVILNKDYCIIGRRDYGYGSSRSGMHELLSDIAPEVYTIVLDHQPRDFEAEAAAGADLVLCGHTHGGQMVPIGPLVGMLGDNDLVYGLEHRDNTDFIVSSGISDWELKFKSGCGAEFVVIDIIPSDSAEVGNSR